ncbi:class I SAM-dependent methyltransferase, partial [Litoricolaceae bacterium]|nr:class I SAM-dependent methyltransferase [Litorivicinaceae bacterium]
NLSRMKNEIGNLKILEIGSFLGMGSTKILDKYAEVLFCIDIWEDSEDNHIRKKFYKRNRTFFETFLDNTEDSNSKIIPIKCKSSEISRFLKENYFDFVFIDGSHRYYDVMKDIQTAKKLVKKDGLILGHDCEGSIDDSNHDQFQIDDIKDLDSVSSSFKNFKEMHPGVILAVHHSFDQVDIFGKKRIEVQTPKGPISGASSIWRFDPRKVSPGETRLRR